MQVYSIVLNIKQVLVWPTMCHAVLTMTTETSKKSVDHGLHYSSIGSPGQMYGRVASQSRDVIPPLHTDISKVKKCAFIIKMCT